MNKRLSVILFLVALVSCGLSFFVASRDKGIVHMANRAFSLPLDQIDRMEIYKGADVVALFKRSGKSQWTVRIPGMQPEIVNADPKAVKELQNFIYNARKMAVDKEIDSGKMAVPANMKQFVVAAGESSQSVYLSGYSDDGYSRYFYADDDLYKKLQADAQITRIFERKPEELRSLNLFDPQQGDGPDAIRISAGDSDPPVVLQRKLGQWIIVEPFTWPADPQAVGRLMRLCSMLRASDIVPDKKAPENAAYIELVKGDDVQRVYIAADDKDRQKIFAFREGVPQGYLVSQAYLLSLKNIRAEDFRLRVLDLLAGRKIAAIEITGPNNEKRRFALQNGVWAADGAGAAAADSQSVADTAKLFSYFVIGKVMDEEGKNPAEFGLEKPDYVLTALDAADTIIAEIELAISPTPPPAAAPDRYFARISGRKQIVELPMMMGAALGRDFLLYKDKHVLNLDSTKVRSLTVRQSGKEREYLRNTATQYQLVKPETKMLSENGNWELLLLVRSMCLLKCQEYLAEKNAKNIQLGLDQPLASAILTMRSTVPGGKGRQITLLVGNKLTLPVPDGKGGQRNSDYYYARIDGGKDIFLLDSGFVGKLLAEYE